MSNRIAAIRWVILLNALISSGLAETEGLHEDPEVLAYRNADAGFVRIWLMTNDRSRRFSIVAERAGRSAFALLDRSVGFYECTEYCRVPSGQYDLKLKVDGPENDFKKIGRLKVTKGAFFTVLVLPNPGDSAHVTCSILPDRAPTDFPYRVVARNFVPDARISIEAPPGAARKRIPCQGKLEFTSIAARVLKYGLVIEEDGRQPYRVPIEVDLTGAGQLATLLIIRDGYGDPYGKVVFDALDPELQ